MDAHGRACMLRGVPDARTKWLLSEDLVPGKKRRKLSETLTDFFTLEDLPPDLPMPDSQSQL